jgi:hypothetical protein
MARCSRGWLVAQFLRAPLVDAARSNRRARLRRRTPRFVSVGGAAAQGAIAQCRPGPRGTELRFSPKLPHRVPSDGHSLTVCKRKACLRQCGCHNHVCDRRGKCMSDQDQAKTRTIGYLPIEKVQMLKGWNEYLEKSTQLSSLRIETQRAKNSVRDALRQRLNEKCEIDFVTDGDRVRVFQVFRKQQQGRRTRSLDLSSSFREDPFGGTSETEGLPSNVPADLDPVTERLTALIRQKTVR